MHDSPIQRKQYNGIQRIAGEGRTTMEEGLRILILEDCADDADRVLKELQRGGIECSFRRVESREQFLREIREFHPTLILSDFDLPSLDGMAALAIAQEQCPEVPFLFVSGPIGEERAVESLKMGATDYVLKDNLSRLVPAVHRALEEAKERGERRRTEEDLRMSHQRLQRMLKGIAQALASYTEKRDPYTAGHQRRVARLAGAIGEEMGLSAFQVEGMRIAAILHDIGKITVPPEILSKPGRITQAEFEIIKAHPQAGYEIIREIEFPWPVGQAILQHHEMLNGSGYPQGLRDGEVILEARVLAVADMVEAMSTHRPYRPALGISTALQELTQSKGTLYDPQVVDACWSLFSQRGFTLEGV
ncbi:MAG: HD domain-containing protein [candidate division NC10 bacterium]|nr:HD domain-containing protein [candidate division NC10 bacterium]